MKTNKLFSFTVFVIAFILSTSVNPLPKANSKETRKVGEFHGISVSSGIDLYITQKNIQEVRVEADEDDMDDLVTKVENGILKIYMKNQSWLKFTW